MKAWVFGWIFPFNEMILKTFLRFHVPVCFGGMKFQYRASEGLGIVLRDLLVSG